MGRTKEKGIGRRVAIYVPVVDEPILAQIAKRLAGTRKEGFRSSFSFEVIRLLKVALAAGTINPHGRMGMNEEGGNHMSASD